MAIITIVHSTDVVLLLLKRKTFCDSEDIQQLSDIEFAVAPRD